MRLFSGIIFALFLFVNNAAISADIDTIPVELKELILSNAKVSDILNFCATSKTHQNICRSDNDLFWQMLIARDFGCAYAKAEGSYANWKEFYQFLFKTRGARSTIAGGYNHTALLDDAGQVWTFGSGNEGQLGHGNVLSQTKPTMIEDIPGTIVAVATGFLHTALLDDKGQVWTFGAGHLGQLGHGNTDSQNKPKMIENVPAKFVAVAAGSRHTVLLDTEGRVWTFGDNRTNQLGHKIKKDSLSTPKMIENIPRIIAVAAHDHTVLLDVNGEVWTFGRGSHGQLGYKIATQTIPRKITDLAVKIKAVAVSDTYTVLLDVNGRVWTFGLGILGHGKAKEQFIPKMIEDLQVGIISVASGTNHIVLLDEDGQVWTFGSGLLGHGKVIENLQVGIISVASGTDHIVLLDENGQVRTFGKGSKGQLGHGDKKEQIDPLQVEGIPGIQGPKKL